MYRVHGGAAEATVILTDFRKARKAAAKMKRSEISASAMREKGYDAFEFGVFSLEQACNYIRNGCECRLEPRYYGAMVGVVVVERNGYKYEYEMFSREMSAEEKEMYKAFMEAENKKAEMVCGRVHAKHKKYMKRH